MFDIGFPSWCWWPSSACWSSARSACRRRCALWVFWLGRMRRSFTTVKTEIEKEIGMDEVRRQLHNEAVMDEMKRIEREVKETGKAAAIKPAAQDQSGVKQQPETRNPDAD